MGEVAAKALTDEEIQQQEMAISVAYCDKMIAEGDDLGVFAMIKKGLLADNPNFEEFNKFVKENRRIT